MTVDCEINLSSAVERTPRVQQLEGLFDIAPAQRSQRSWRHKFILPDAWHIGAIVGPSGAGKTTLARRVFGEHLSRDWSWLAGPSILDGFPQTLGIREITGLLCSVGFSSPPSWLRPFGCLSNGEQFRVNLARALAESADLTVVDEFSSVVDRATARIGAAAVAKAVRNSRRKFIAVTCHYDCLDWLEPDWVYEPHLGRLTLNPADSGGRRLWRRPAIHLEIVAAGTSAWKVFSPHHYLSGSLHPAAQCFVGRVTLGDDAGEPEPAAFVAALSFPHPIKPGWREHRCVCLPEFQGVGIGNALSEFVAGVFAGRGKRYRSTTSHPGMIRHRARSPLWRMIRRPSFRHKHGGMATMSGAIGRLTASFEYVGPAVAA